MTDEQHDLIEQLRKDGHAVSSSTLTSCVAPTLTIAKTRKTMNREQLTLALVNHIYDDMSLEDLHEFVCCRLHEDYKGYTDEEFREELEEYAPHLIEETTISKQRPHCPECGSAEVYVDAFAAWDDEKQEWSLANTYEAMTCGECSYEFKQADWRDIE